MKKRHPTYRRLPNNLPQKLKFLLGIVVCIAGLYYLSFNSYGIVRHFHTKGELQKIQKQIEKLETQQDGIKNTIDKLQSDYDYIERLAREKLKLVKKGEELYIIKQKR